MAAIEVNGGTDGGAVIVQEQQTDVMGARASTTGLGLNGRFNITVAGHLARGGYTTRHGGYVDIAALAGGISLAGNGMFVGRHSSGEGPGSTTITEMPDAAGNPQITAQGISKGDGYTHAETTVIGAQLGLQAGLNFDLIEATSANVVQGTGLPVYEAGLLKVRAGFGFQGTFALGGGSAEGDQFATVSNPWGGASASVYGGPGSENKAELVHASSNGINLGIQTAIAADIRGPRFTTSLFDKDGALKSQTTLQTLVFQGYGPGGELAMFNLGLTGGSSSAYIIGGAGEAAANMGAFSAAAAGYDPSVTTRGIGGNLDIAAGFRFNGFTFQHYRTTDEGKIAPSASFSLFGLTAGGELSLGGSLGNATAEAGGRDARAQVAGPGVTVAVGQLTG